MRCRVTYGMLLRIITGDKAVNCEFATGADFLSPALDADEVFETQKMIALICQGRLHDWSTLQSGLWYLNVAL